MQCTTASPDLRLYRNFKSWLQAQYDGKPTEDEWKVIKEEDSQAFSQQDYSLDGDNGDAEIPENEDYEDYLFKGILHLDQVHEFIYKIRCRNYLQVQSAAEPAFD